MSVIKGFEKRRQDVHGVEIAYAVAGSGPPLLLLHGYPQTHAMWHRIAPELARDYTVIAADLRGYGDSAKPPGGERHEAYSKKAMAADMAGLMTVLGHRRFAVLGHDRGARVTHRLALDHPDRLAAVSVMDICPTLHMYRTADDDFARAYYHWFFLIQPYDMPERMIGADPEYYLSKKMKKWSGGDFLTPESFAEYQRCFSDPATIHATCEDYRAAAGIDLEHDEADRGRKVSLPLLAIWGSKGFVGRKYDVLAVWRDYAENVTGGAVTSGHYVAEEAPEETLALIRPFLAQHWPA